MAEIDLMKQIAAMKARMDDLKRRQDDIVAETAEVLEDMAAIGERIAREAPQAAPAARLLQEQMRTIAAGIKAMGHG